MNTLRHQTFLLSFIILALGCGVDPQEHQRVVHELEETKGKLDQLDQDSAAAPLYNEALASLAASDQVEAEAKFNDVRSRFPKSSYAIDASKRLSDFATARRLTADGSVIELEMVELFRMALDSNSLKAKQQVDGKIFRVPGKISSVSAEGDIFIWGYKSDAGNDVTMHVELKKNHYDKSVLSTLEKGMPVTVQGRFRYSTIIVTGWLEDAVFVDSKSGRALSASDIRALVNKYSAQKAARE